VKRAALALIVSLAGVLALAACPAGATSGGTGLCLDCGSGGGTFGSLANCPATLCGDVPPGEIRLFAVVRFDQANTHDPITTKFVKALFARDDSSDGAIVSQSVDVGALVFITLMEASREAQQDLKAIMDQVRRLNKQRRLTLDLEYCVLPCPGGPPSGAGG
jgi:hypothetical protein